jgi:dTMP kinase
MSYPLVVFEGIDGSGKTTLRNAVWHELLAAGVPTIAMGQHSWLDVDSGRLLAYIRSHPPGSRKFTPADIAASYLQDKYLHWTETIEPALTKAVVLLDRFTLRDAVYMEALYGLPAEALLETSWARLGRAPNLLVYLDLEPITAERRIVLRARESKHYENSVDLAEIRTRYLRLLGQERLRHQLYTGHCMREASRSPSDAVAITHRVVAHVTAMQAVQPGYTRRTCAARADTTSP